LQKAAAKTLFNRESLLELLLTQKQLPEVMSHKGVSISNHAMLFARARGFNDLQILAAVGIRHPYEESPLNGGRDGFWFVNQEQQAADEEKQPVSIGAEIHGPQIGRE